MSRTAFNFFPFLMVFSRPSMVRRLCGLHREAVVAMVDGHRSLEKLGRIAVLLLLPREEGNLSDGAGPEH